MNVKELLEETTLNESTYDIDAIIKIVDYAAEKLKGKQSGQINITNKLRESFPWITSAATIIIKLKDTIFGVSPKSIGATSNSVKRTETGARRPSILIEMLLTTKSSLFKKSVRHEIIHALDYFKAYSAKRNFPKFKDRKNYEKFYMSYRISDDIEFNQTVNEVKLYKNNEAYNRINNVKDLIIFFVLAGSAHRKVTGGLSKALKKVNVNNVDIQKKLIRRLARENLLPDAMK